MHFMTADASGLLDVFPDTNARTPVIFVLSTGADPTAQLQRFAEKKGWTARERLHMISLGQGQGRIAETLLAAAMKSGDWICLQNCHLAKSWMMNLETIVANLSAPSSNVHEDFRLWLTSMPAESFPVLVLWAHSLLRISSSYISAKSPQGPNARLTCSLKSKPCEE